MAGTNKTLEADKAEEQKLQREADSPHEQAFRRRRTHHSFLGALYSAIGGAAFIGVLNTLVGLAIGTVTIGGAILGLPVGVVLGAFVAAGVAATLFAEREYAKMASLQDNHLAECTARAKKLEREQEKLAASQLPKAPITQPINPLLPSAVEEMEKRKSFVQSELARREAAVSQPTPTTNPR